MFLRYMMTRDPKLGTEKICFIHDEDADSYIGNYVSGFAALKQKFDKKLTRPMTEEEVDNYNSFRFRKQKLIPFQLKINYDGTPKTSNNA